jgi:predicted PurR-regulated permease PerM
VARVVDNPFLESGRVLGHYVKSQLLITGIVSVLYSVGFALAHVPLWLLVGILNGLCYLVPRFGSLVGLAILALAGLAGELDTTHWMIAAVVWVGVQAIEGFILTPRILGNRLGLSPFVVFLVLIAGSLVFGPIGLLIAVPLAAVLNVFWRYFRQSRPERT